MRRRTKAGSNTVKTQRRKTLRRGNAPKAARRRSNRATGSKETNVEQLARELAEAREREAATAEVLKVISRRPANWSRSSTLCWRTQLASVRLRLALCICARGLHFVA